MSGEKEITLNPARNGEELTWKLRKEQFSMDDLPLISVIIPVKNGDVWLRKLIPAILNQSLASKTEIILIDSGSTDQTKSVVRRYPVRMICIEPEEFNHGTTRNLGVKESKGKYVVMTVQDAKPVGKQMARTTS